MTGFAMAAAAGWTLFYGLSHALSCDPLRSEVSTPRAAASASCSFCSEPPRKDCKLCMTQNPLLIANAAGSASTTLRLCNEGADEPMLALFVSAFSVPVGDSASYGLSPPQPMLVAVSDAERAIVGGNAKFSKGSCVLLKVDAAGLLQPGVHTATISNDAQTIAELKALRLDFPFALRPGGPRADRFDAVVGPGRPFAIPIYNDDPFPYRFAWRLELDGLVQEGVEEVAARQRVDLKPTLNPASACWLESGFLRSGARSGKLFLRHAPDPSFSGLDARNKSIDIGVKVDYYAPNWQRVANIRGILLTLLAGIGVSLLLTYAWPMYRRRLAIKRRLAQQDGRLAGTGLVVPTRLLSLMRIEKRRLREELHNRWSFDPETEAALDALEPRVEALGRRIELTAKAGDLLKSVQGDPLLAQHEFDEAERHARQVFQVAETSHAAATDLERADAALVSIMAVRARRDSDPPAVLVEALRARAQTLNGRFAGTPALPADLLELLGGFRALFLSADETAPSRERFVDAANAVAKAEAIRIYVDLLDSADPVVKASRLARGGDLLAALRPGASAAMRLAAARAVLDEIEQNVTGAEVVAAVSGAQPGTLTIEVDPPTPRDYQLVLFRVHLRQPGLDEAMARERVRWSWSIGGMPLRDGDDWVAWHFFEPQARSDRLKRWLASLVGVAGDNTTPSRRFDVAAQATDRQKPGDPIATVRREGVQIEGTKTYAENALMVAVVGLLITVLLAGIALVATAQEKVQALDWMAGTAVVFGLGFAADVLKRAVQKA
jgi:hypothetical protein